MPSVPPSLPPLHFNGEEFPFFALDVIALFRVDFCGADRLAHFPPFVVPFPYLSLASLDSHSHYLLPRPKTRIHSFTVRAMMHVARQTVQLFTAGSALDGEPK